jgi:hypothetical protein
MLSIVTSYYTLISYVNISRFVIGHGQKDSIVDNFKANLC